MKNLLIIPLLGLVFLCHCQTLINSDIIETNTLFGSNIYKPNGVYFNAVTNGNIPNGVYYLEENETLSLIQEGARIQFEHNGSLILKNTVDHELFLVDLSTNASSLVFDDSNFFLISQRVIEVNGIYYFVGYDIAQNHYAMMSIDLNGLLNTISVFSGPIQNTNRLHQDNGILYFFTNTLSPSAQHYYSFDPSSGIINAITSQEYGNHPYPYFNNALTSVNANGDTYTLNSNNQLANSSTDPDLTCFDLIGSEGSPRLEILGSINDKVYLLLNFNLGSTNGLYRYPQDTSNGLCQNDCSIDVDPPICMDGPFTVELDPGQNYYTFDINDFFSDDCAPILTYENASLDPSTPNGNSPFSEISMGSNDEFSCGTYIVTSSFPFDDAGNFSDCAFTFTVECGGGASDNTSFYKVLGTDSQDHLRELYDDGENILLTGFTDLGNEILPFISKFSDTGEEIWSINLSDSIYINDIKSEDSSIFFVGQTPFGSESKSIIGKITDNGNSANIDWINYYDLFYTFSNGVLSNIPDRSFNLIIDDDKIFVHGSALIPNSIPQESTMVLELDQFGSVIENYRYIYDDSSNRDPHFWREFRLNSLTGFMIFGHNDDGGTGRPASFIYTDDNRQAIQTPLVPQVDIFYDGYDLGSRNILLVGLNFIGIINTNGTFNCSKTISGISGLTKLFGPFSSPVTGENVFYAKGYKSNNSIIEDVICEFSIVDNCIELKWIKELVVPEYSSNSSEGRLSVSGYDKFTYADSQLSNSGNNNIILSKFSSNSCYLQDLDLSLSDLFISTELDGFTSSDYILPEVTPVFYESATVFACESLPSCPGDSTSCNNTILNFDGINDKVITDSPLSGNSDYTISVDFKGGFQNGGSYPRLISFTSFETEIAVKGADLAYYNGSTWKDNPGLNVADNEWHNVTLTRTNATNNLYLDGQLISSDVAPATLNFNGSMVIGGKVSGSNEFFGGSIDNVRVWDFAVSSSEICNSIETPIAGSSIDYNFEEGIPEADNAILIEVIDQSGNNNSGTLNNFALSSSSSNFLCDSIIIVSDSCGTIPPTCTEDCQTNEVDLSTGLDFIDDSLLPIGQYDGGWVMISGPDMSLNYPQPGFVLTPDGAWSGQLDAQFISPFANTSNNMSFPEPYTFERQFCICESTNIELEIAALFDNFLEIGLYDQDGNLIEQLINVQTNSVDNFQISSTSSTTHQLLPGTYSLRAGLRNDMNVSMGMAIEASLSGAGLIESGCCSPYQYITGTVFEDTTCDSIYNLNSDPVISDIVISLCYANGQELQQSTTDAQGFYTFFDVEPGTYIVKQAEISHLTITLGNGGYELNVEANTVSSNIDFGNCNDPCAVDMIDPTCNTQNIVVSLDQNGNASIIPQMIDNGSADNCGEVSLELSNNTFSCGDIGDNEVILFVTDLNGNSSSCTANVTIEDKTNPICSTQNIVVSLDQNGNVDIIPQMIDNGSADECGEVSLELSNNTFSCGDIGENEVILFVTDTSGNSSSCVSSVKVEDKIAPMCSAVDVTISLDSEGFASVTPQQVNSNSMDECGDVSLSILGNALFNCNNLGIQEVTLLVTDGSGNTSSCISQVTIVDLNNVCIDPCDNDTIPPVVACPAIYLTYELDENGLLSLGISDFNLSVEDNCDGKIRYEFSQAIFNCAHIGLNNIMINVIDESGNTASCTINIIIQDTGLNCDDCEQDITPPIVVCTNSVVAYILSPDGFANINLDLHDINAYDDCGIDQIISEIPVLTCSDLTTIPQSISVIVSDQAGNMAQCEITYILVDINNYCKPEECPETCFANSINLSTGVDINGLELPIGQYESNWQLISGPDSDINYPRPGYVLNPNSVWDQLPGSQYISPFPNAVNNQSFAEAYLFERCFCVCEEEALVQLNIAAHADNFINIGLYDDSGLEIQELIDYQNPPNTSSFLDPAFVSNTTHNLTSGTYCLRAGLRNDGSQTMGMQINASITNAGFIATECCNPNAYLLGTIFQDVQCDTINNQNQDIAIDGVTVNLFLDGVLVETTTSDVYGYYVFSSLAAGNYVVEVLKPTGSDPTLGHNGYNITLEANSSIGGLDFGFCYPDEQCCNTEAELEATACQTITSASIEFVDAQVTITEPSLENCQRISQILWGDGEFDDIGQDDNLPSHTYDSDGTYIISIVVISLNANDEICNTTYVDLVYTIQDCITSVDNPLVDGPRFKVYPVPFNSFVELQFVENFNGFDGELIDIAGGLVTSFNVDVNVDNFTLDTENLVSGAYTISLIENTTGTRLLARVIKVD